MFSWGITEGDAVLDLHCFPLLALLVTGFFFFKLFYIFVSEEEIPPLSFQILPPDLFNLKTTAIQSLAICIVPVGLKAVDIQEQM